METENFSLFFKVQEACLWKKPSEQNQIIYIHISNLSLMCATVVEIWSESKFIKKILSSRGITLYKNHQKLNQIWTQLLYSYDTSIYKKLSWMCATVVWEMIGNWMMTELQKDGRTKWRNRVTLYAPVISWLGHKHYYR